MLQRPRADFLWPDWIHFLACQKLERKHRQWWKTFLGYEILKVVCYATGNNVKLLVPVCLCTGMGQCGRNWRDVLQVPFLELAVHIHNPNPSDPLETFVFSLSLSLSLSLSVYSLFEFISVAPVGVTLQDRKGYFLSSCFMCSKEIVQIDRIRCLFDLVTEPVNLNTESIIIFITFACVLWLTCLFFNWLWRKQVTK